MDMQEIAKYAYIAFLAIAIVVGLAMGFMAWQQGYVYAEIDGYITLVMLILGIIIGIASITAEEVTPFLIATIALMVVGLGSGATALPTTQAEADAFQASGAWAPLWNIEGLRLLFWWAATILNYIVAFAAPAAVIIAIKAVFAMAKE